MKTIILRFCLCLLFFCFVVPAHAAAGKLRVCATIPDLGSIVREIAGDHVELIVFAKGTEDAHFVDAKPSFITALSKADLFVQSGMELEIGWAPVLLQNARNSKVLPGANGFVDASTVITPLEIPKGILDRSLGDVHPAGNPHFLLDPVNGVKVARLLRDRLTDLQPELKDTFEKGYEHFRRQIATALVGEKLASKYDIEKLALLADHQRLASFLQKQGEAELLSGWLGAMKPYAGTQAIVDHNMWPYFATRFGLEIMGSLEPKPGVQPTTKHLGEVIKAMKARNAKIVLASSYYDPRHARFVSENTGAAIIPMAHQVGSRPGTEDYLSMIAYDVKQVSDALSHSLAKE